MVLQPSFQKGNSRGSVLCGVDSQGKLPAIRRCACRRANDATPEQPTCSGVQREYRGGSRGSQVGPLWALAQGSWPNWASIGSFRHRLAGGSENCTVFQGRCVRHRRCKPVGSQKGNRHDSSREPCAEQTGRPPATRLCRRVHQGPVVGSGTCPRRAGRNACGRVHSRRYHGGGRCHRGVVSGGRPRHGGGVRIRLHTRSRPIRAGQRATRSPKAQEVGTDHRPTLRQAYRRPTPSWRASACVRRPSAPALESLRALESRTSGPAPSPRPVHATSACPSTRRADRCCEGP